MPTMFSKLCSADFTSDCFYQYVGKTNFREGAVPTLFSSQAAKSQRSPRLPQATTTTTNRACSNELAGSARPHVQSPAQPERASSSPEVLSLLQVTCSGDHTYAVVSPRQHRVLLAASRRKLQRAKRC
ncbi:unnamed protein product [Ixodes hexagonus]